MDFLQWIFRRSRQEEKSFTMDTFATNTSNIPDDILISIATRLHSLIDVFHFSQVCKSWNSVTLSSPLINKFRIPQPPLLLLAESKKETHQIQTNGEEEGDDPVFRRQFVGLNDEDCVYELHLPKLYQNRCIGSIGNWLITVNKEVEFHIFNPFSRTQLSLPSQSTLPDQYPDEDGYTLEELRDRFSTKLVLSSSPREHLDDCVVGAVIYCPQRRLAFARPGDKSWVPVQKNSCTVGIEDVIFYNDQFFSVNSRGKVAVYDIDCSPPQAIQLFGAFPDCCSVSQFYLVEWLGELLLVVKYCSFYDEEPYYKTNGFEVFKADFDET